MQTINKEKKKNLSNGTAYCINIFDITLVFIEYNFKICYVLDYYLFFKGLYYEWFNWNKFEMLNYIVFSEWEVTFAFVKNSLIYWWEICSECLS